MTEDDESVDEAGEPGGRGRSPVVLSLVRLAVYAVYAFVMKALGRNVTRIEQKIDRRLDSLESRLDAFGRRLSIIGLLVLVFVVVAIVVQVVWLFVGVVWLVKNTALTTNPIVFVIGLVVGYAACLVTGVIYMRR